MNGAGGNANKFELGFVFSFFEGREYLTWTRTVNALAAALHHKSFLN